MSRKSGNRRADGHWAFRVGRSRWVRLVTVIGWLLTGWSLAGTVGFSQPPTASTPAQPSQGQFDWERAVSLYKQGQYRAAIGEFQGVLTEHPTHADSWKFVGLAYLALEAPAEAIPALQRAFELKEQQERIDPSLRRALAEAHLAERGYAQALPHLEWLTGTVATRGPEGERAGDWYLLGLAYAGLERGEEATRALDRALTLDPGNLAALQFLAGRSIREGRPTEAIARLRMGLVTAPKQAELWGLLAEALLRQASEVPDEKARGPLLEEAIRSATTLTSLREEAAAFELLGRAYLAAGRYPQSERALSRSLQGNEQPGANLYFQLGYVLVQLKSWKRAIEMLTQADQLAPQQVPTLSLLGFAYENERRYPLAYETYRRAYLASGETDADLQRSFERLSPLLSPPQN